MIRLLIILNLITFLSPFLFSYDTLADVRLEIFREKMETMEHAIYDAEHPDNPLGPYLDIHPEEGLSNEDRAELLRLQEAEDCYPASMLIVKGFRQLYPFLSPAFEGRINVGKVEVMINEHFYSSGMRCFHTKLFRQLFERHGKDYFQPVDLPVALAKRYGKVKVKPVPDRALMISAQFARAKIAFCRDYPPVIGDVLASANQSGGIKLSIEEQHYLTVRAHVREWTTEAEYEASAETLRTQYETREDFEHIKRAGERGDVAPIGPFWALICDHFHLFRYR